MAGVLSADRFSARPSSSIDEMSDLLERLLPPDAGIDKPADLVGKGLIVHRDPDDYKTQPTGNAGPRIACAVISVAGRP